MMTPREVPLMERLGGATRGSVGKCASVGDRCWFAAGWGERNDRAGWPASRHTIYRSTSRTDVARDDVLFQEVTQVLDALDHSRVRHWVGGGWGVDVLVARQTRDHRDLDLAVDAEHLQTCLRTLNDLGYGTEVDWLPVRAI